MNYGFKDSVFTPRDKRVVFALKALYLGLSRLIVFLLRQFLKIVMIIASIVEGKINIVEKRIWNKKESINPGFKLLK